jgi:hypothetical protein
LTTLFESHAAAIVSATEIPVAPKKHSRLPVLVVLFLISYGLMTMLIVEQGETILSQRALIRDLFRDSQELSAVKISTLKERPLAPSTKAQNPSTKNPSTQIPSTQIPSTQNPSTKNPSTQIPSTQAPRIQAPSSQAGPQHGAQNEASKHKRQFRLPSKPAADLVDDCRTLITI